MEAVDLMGDLPFPTSLTLRRMKMTDIKYGSTLSATLTTGQQSMCQMQTIGNPISGSTPLSATSTVRMLVKLLPGFVPLKVTQCPFVSPRLEALQCASSMELFVVSFFKLRR